MLTDSLSMAHPAPGSSTPGGAGVHSVPLLPARLLDQVAHRGWLEDPRLAGGLLAAAALVAVAAFALRRRTRRLARAAPRRRWPARAALGAIVAILVVAAAAAGVNSYAGYLPDLSAVGGPAAGTVSAAGLRQPPAVVGSRVVRLDIAAPRLHEPARATYVYLPPGYANPANARQRYPVVYLIHGSPGRSVDWFAAGRIQHTMDVLIAHRYVGPMIIVAPDASNGWWSDTECLDDPRGIHVESYLTYTVVDAVDRLFRTVADRAGRAIGGMSAGAFCALNIGLHHPHRFAVLLATEPYGEPGRHALRTMLHGNRTLYLANSPVRYLPRLPLDQPVSVLLDVGTDDHSSLRAALTIARGLGAHGEPVALRLHPHQADTWLLARREAAYSLVFAWTQLSHARDGGSDAADARSSQELVAWASGQLHRSRQGAVLAGRARGHGRL